VNPDLIWLDLNESSAWKRLPSDVFRVESMKTACFVVWSAEFHGSIQIFVLLESAIHNTNQLLYWLISWNSFVNPSGNPRNLLHGDPLISPHTSVDLPQHFLVPNATDIQEHCMWDMMACTLAETSTLLHGVTTQDINAVGNSNHKKMSSIFLPSWLSQFLLLWWHWLAVFSNWR
jgi:hypothetical protein